MPRENALKDSQLEAVNFHKFASDFTSYHIHSSHKFAQIQGEENINLPSNIGGILESHCMKTCALGENVVIIGKCNLPHPVNRIPFLTLSIIYMLCKVNSELI